MIKLKQNFIGDFSKLRVLSFGEWFYSLLLILLGITLISSARFFIVADEDWIPRLFWIVLGALSIFRGLTLPFEIMESKINKANYEEHLARGDKN